MEEKSSQTKKQYKVIGKDEMNLLEFCIFSASERVDRKTKSLVFENSVYCNIEHKKVTRRLTAAFSSEYGRPTARDDNLLLAMMKKSRDEGFENQRVYFTRYELLKILGWPENGQSYRRLDEGFNRLVGTHLVWDNAFWDNEEKSWVDRKFSIIDDVQLYDREKWDKARVRLNESYPQSWFKWSDVMFESFQAGYIKSVDLDFLQSLQSNVSRRLYRWLDKHFNNRKRRMPIEIPVASLATQKLGFQSVPASHLKRMLLPAIEELQALTYIAPEMTRFEGRGKDCKIRFRPASQKKSPRKKRVGEHEGLSPLASELVSRGVNRKQAIQWASDVPEEAKRQLEHLDWLIQSNHKVIKGTGAWLNAAIQGKFQPPPEFETRAEKAAKAKRSEKLAAKNEAVHVATQAQRSQHERQREVKIATYLKSLSPAKRVELEERSLREGEPFLRQRYEELVRSGDQQMASVYRDTLLLNEVAKILQCK